MIIASWNINSIRIRTQQVVDYLLKKKIDILVLQEIKTRIIANPINKRFFIFKDLR